MSVLDTLGLTAEQIARRQHTIGASDANIIMGDDPDKLLKLWRVKRGEEPPEDLSDKFHVALGQYTERLNLDWVERYEGLGRITKRGHEAARAYGDVMMTVTLDGVASDGCPIDAKHVNGFSKLEDVVARYTPQMYHQMYVIGASRSYLSIIIGTNAPVVVEIERDELYMAALLDAEARFWQCVQTGEPPVPVAAPPPPLDEMREVDMTGSNEWASYAAEWIEHKDAADRFRKAGAALRKLVPDDVRRAHGHGIEIARDKRGALRIREMGDG